MSGKYPNDRANERQDVPETYDRHRERFNRAEAAIRQADDPVSGARPETEPVEPEADELSGESGAPRA